MIYCIQIFIYLNSLDVYPRWQVIALQNSMKKQLYAFTSYMKYHIFFTRLMEIIETIQNTAYKKQIWFYMYGCYFDQFETFKLTVWNFFYFLIFISCRH